MTSNRRCVDILFYIENKLYEARVFQFQPTAIIVPDQNVIMVTTLSPSPDSSTSKNRYQKDIKADRTNASKTQRSIFDSTGRLNPLSTIQIPVNQPLACNYRYLTIATRNYTNPK